MTQSAKILNMNVQNRGDVGATIMAALMVKRLANSGANPVLNWHLFYPSRINKRQSIPQRNLNWCRKEIGHLFQRFDHSPALLPFKSLKVIINLYETELVLP